jgi:2-methylcitrate dehydratase PrpD
MHETCALAQCVAQTQFTAVPASLVDDCKIMVLDTFGAGFVGAMHKPRHDILSTSGNLSRLDISTFHRCNFARIVAAILALYLA